MSLTWGLTVTMSVVTRWWRSVISVPPLRQWRCNQRRFPRPDTGRTMASGVCNIIPTSCHSRSPESPSRMDEKQIDSIKLDKLNNNIEENNNVKREEKIPPTRSSHFPPSHHRVENVERLEFSRSRELMSRLCTTNPQFTASVLEDYIRPIFREGDVVLEVECGSNAAVM